MLSSSSGAEAVSLGGSASTRRPKAKVEYLLSSMGHTDARQIFASTLLAF